jgi:uncharacterized protein (DUF362 family)
MKNTITEIYLSSGDTVLLKVNAIIGFAPDRAATTHPAVVLAMVRISGISKSFSVAK